MRGIGGWYRFERSWFSGLLLLAACGTAPVGEGETTHESEGLRTPAPAPTVPAPTASAGSERTERFLREHAPRFEPLPIGERGSALGMAKVQASSLRLSPTDLERLEANGFVIDRSRVFPTFHYAYAAIYGEDLPVYISADSVLHALHRSFDRILMTLELTRLQRALSGFLRELLERLPQAPLTEKVRRDLTDVLEVGYRLLESDGLVRPLPTPPEPRIKASVEHAIQANGPHTIQLFGADREIDFSRFTPNGHYVSGLSGYYKAMMWLALADFRLVETLNGGIRRLHRRQVEATVALWQLLTPELRAQFWEVEAPLSVLFGAQDSLTLPQVETLVASFRGEPLSRIPDTKLERLILEERLGEQRIAGRLIVNEGSSPLPRDASFALFGQRYVRDSHVLSEVVWDRVPTRRMMASPLDVAYGALGNHHAAQLLGPELRRYDYSTQLERVRKVVDRDGAEPFDANVYDSWLGALRALSVGPQPDSRLPPVARTEAWSRRLLNTQLASWAELRHDAQLYAKQAYGSEASCDFPDAYVDPYPELWARLARLATQLQQLATPGDQLADFARNFVAACERLQQMAVRQLSGQPHTKEDLEFVNDLIKTRKERQFYTVVTVPKGWYSKLFFELEDVITPEPTVADVYTQPSNESGNRVGRVLHVTTGLPRVMVVTVETCNGLRSYVGPVSDYGELVTEDFQRLDDSTWQLQLGKAGKGSRPPSFLQSLFGD